MNGLVVDTSIVLAWVFEDESSAVADRVMADAAEVPIIVPGIWWYEFHNALIISERRGRISAWQSKSFIQSIGELNIEYETAHDRDALMGLARDHQLTVYDAAHLEVARRRHLVLATLDRRLAGAARSAGVSLIAEEL